jgi:hypothetical protein
MVSYKLAIIIQKIFVFTNTPQNVGSMDSQKITTHFE